LGQVELGSGKKRHVKQILKGISGEVKSGQILSVRCAVALPSLGCCGFPPAITHPHTHTLTPVGIR
jgi:hypothetical protein